MKMLFKEMELKNYKKFSDLRIKFGKVTKIKGANTLGKSTIGGVMNWIFFNVGKPRPHDANGIDIDRVDISAKVVLEIDGTNIEVEKIQKQKWVKEVLKGNTNSYIVNGVAKTEKEFNAFVNEVIISDELLNLCTNIDYFMSKSVADRREILSKYVGNISADDVIALNPRFEELKDKLAYGDLKQLKKTINSSSKELEKERDTIPVLIQHELSQKADYPIAELELQKNSLEEQIKAIDDTEKDLVGKYQSIQNTSANILSLQFEKNEIVRKANESMYQKRMEANAKAVDLDMQRDRKVNDKAIISKNLESVNESIEVTKKTIERLNIEKYSIDSSVIDEKSLICNYCGQEYPADRKDKIRADFELNKIEQMDKIDKIIAEKNENLINLTLMVNDANNSISKLAIEIEKLTNDIIKQEEEISKMPESVDMNNIPEYLDIVQRIEQANKLIDGMKETELISIENQSKKSKLQEELFDIRCKLAKNLEIDDKVSELRKKQKELSQKIADNYYMLDLVKDFERTKADILEKSINDKFGFVKFRLYRALITSDDVEDLCDVMIDGSNFTSDLNKGNRILAAIDMLSTFQKLNNVQLPLFIDDVESIDPWRIPSIDNQLILLERTNDRDLVIESEEQ